MITGVAAELSHVLKVHKITQHLPAAGDAETERNLIQLDESVEAVEYLAEPLQVAVSAVSVPMSEKVRVSGQTQHSPLAAGCRQHVAVPLVETVDDRMA